MGFDAVVGQTLLSLADLDEIGVEHTERIDRWRAAGQQDTDLDVRLKSGRTLRYSEAFRAPEAPEDDRPLPFKQIGIGKPLTVRIETVYVGDYPDTVRWLPGDQTGDVLITSAHKPFQQLGAAQRAVHLLTPNPERKSRLEFKATMSGSRLVYYAPAITDSSIVFTMELSVDRQFNDELADGLAEALKAAGALPVFAPAAPYLIAGSAAVQIGQKAAQMLARPHMFFEATVDIDFSTPGRRATPASALVLYAGEESPFLGSGVNLAKDYVLRDDDGNAYKGEHPYVVVSLDGTDRPELDGWSAQAASSALLERFYNPDSAVSQSLGVATQSLSLFNDMSYREKADKALREVTAAGNGPESAEKRQLYKAYWKNIKDDAIRTTLPAPDEE